MPFLISSDQYSPFFFVHVVNLHLERVFRGASDRSRTRNLPVQTLRRPIVPNSACLDLRRVELG
jgi:hypothetical protein